MNDICILHDQFRVLGGAERVACEMARALDAPILAARVEEDVPPADVEVREIFDGLPARMMRSHYLVQDLAQMFAWQHRPEVYEFDTVICNKTNPLWYVPQDDQTVIGYLHSTPRGFYDQFYQQGEALPSRILKTTMKTLYESNRIQPDAWACNSDLVERRARLYWDRQTRIRTLYPPVPVHEYSSDHAPTREYYLAFGRLHGHKNFASVIRAFRGTDRNLVIGGDGPERDHLEDLADGHENITLVGYMSEDEKRRRLAEARALIAPHEREDFGITPIEAFAAGTPVIGVSEGFTQHQIIDGQNGYLYEREPPFETRSLQEALDRFSRRSVDWSKHDLERFAARFGVDRFHTELRDWIDEVEAATSVVAPWERDDDDEVEKQLPEPALTDGGES